MMTKLVRIGRDAEMKYLPSGTAILEMSVVYDVGFGDKKAGQWVKLAMFGQRAEKLVSHFTKGKQIVASMDDVKSEAWIKDGEAKSAISAKLIEFAFVSDGQPQQQQAQPHQQAPQQAPQYQQPAPQQAPQQAPPQSYGQKPPVPNNPANGQQETYHHPASNGQPAFDDTIPF
jgi:single-strand DNA-binding protein